MLLGRLAAACLVVLLTGSAAPAVADSWRAPEPRRDVVRYHHDADPEPCGTTTVEHLRRDASADVTALAVRHTADRVTIVTRFRDLRRGSHQYTELPLRTDERTYVVDLVRSDGGPFVGLVKWAPPKDVGACGAYGDVRPAIACDDASGKISAAHDRMRVSLPRTCLSNPSWVRAGASVMRSHRGGTRYDDWAPDGVTYVKYLGWLGPRVRHD